MSEPRQLLVSLCNLEHERPSGLLWIQTNPFDAIWVSCGPEKITSSGTGLARNSEHFFMTGHSAGTTYVKIISQNDFSFVDYFLLPKVTDAHSLAWHEKRLFIVSTGSDSVYSVDPYRGAKSLKVEWSASATGVDSRHLNGLCVVKDQLLCCGFGEKKGASWNLAKDGFVRNLSTGKMLLRGLHQPHSIFPDDSGVILCESTLGTVRTLKGTIRKFAGYTRGLNRLPDGKFCVGLSSRRIRSKSTGRLNQGVQEANRGKCGIAIFSIGRSAEVEFHDLSAFGDEIYDVLSLAESPPEKIIRRWRAAERTYQRTLEWSIADSRSWGQQLDAELAKTRSAHAEQTKLAEERTTWAKKLDIQLGTAAAEHTRLQGEHTKAVAWAQKLDGELAKLRTVHTEQAKLLDERTTWAKSLEKDLKSSATNFAKLTKEHTERTTWAQKLEAEVERVAGEYKKLQGDHDKTVTWAKSLNAELNKARDTLTAASLVAEERAAHAKSLDRQLQEARAASVARGKVIEERTAWAKSLETSVQSTKANFDKVAKDHAERTAWAEKLAAKISVMAAEIDRLQAEHSKVAAWAGSLKTEMTEARAAQADATRIIENRTTWAKNLELELQETKENFARISKMNAERTAWAKSLEADLVVAREAFSKASRLADERTTWAKSLDDKLKSLRAELRQVQAQSVERERELKDSRDDAKSTRYKLASYEDKYLVRLIARIAPSRSQTQPK